MGRGRGGVGGLLFVAVGGCETEVVGFGEVGFGLGVLVKGF